MTAPDLDFLDEHTLRSAARHGQVVAQTCRDGVSCEEGSVLLALYEGMAARGLLQLTRMWGSRYSPEGAQFVSFAPTAAGLAVLEIAR